MNTTTMNTTTTVSRLRNVIATALFGAVTWIRRTLCAYQGCGQ